LEQMHGHPEWSRIPVVVVSGMDDMDSIIRCVEQGAADFLLKPYKSRLLRARVQSCLAEARLRKRETALRLLTDRYNHELESRVAEQVRQIAEAHVSTLFALSTLAE